MSAKSDSNCLLGKKEEPSIKPNIAGQKKDDRRAKERRLIFQYRQVNMAEREAQRSSGIDT